MYSILEKNENIHFHIFTTKIECDEIERFQKLKNCNITIYILNSVFFENFQICGHFSQGIYYRLVIPYVLSHLDKVLYLDSDVICIDNMDELFHCNLGDNIIAAIQDPISRKHFTKLREHGFPLLDIYFNSGVMLINILQWIKNDVFDKFISIISQGDFDYPDQDVLNILFCGKVKYIPEQYNWLGWYKHADELRKNEHGIVLVHCVGETKPWDEINIFPIYKEIYKKSFWSSVKTEIPTTRNHRKIANKLWQEKKYLLSIIYRYKYFYRKVKKLK
ncbi:glycosyl transferase family protein [Actinobacillus ureae]|nr:glycosyl transferase family protein [Actinobacillus ureae]